MASGNDPCMFVKRWTIGKVREMHEPRRVLEDVGRQPWT